MPRQHNQQQDIFAKYLRVVALTCFLFTGVLNPKQATIYKWNQSELNQGEKEEKGTDGHNRVLTVWKNHNLLGLHWEANNQKFMRNDSEAVNQLRKAMAVAVSNCAQWFCEHSPRSLPIRTVMPAEAQAAANVSVEVICKKNIYIF